MQRVAGITCGLTLVAIASASLSVAEDKGAVMVPRTYPVADLVTPLPHAIELGTDAVKQAPPAAALDFEPLIAHIKKVTGSRPWKDGGEIKPLPPTLSLVIRQTQEMHERIVDELQRLRKEQDLQIVTETIIVTGPRNAIAETATAFSGELGRFEQEQFREALQKSKSLKALTSLKITTFNRQPGVVGANGKSVLMHAAVADDRRTVGLKIAYGPDEAPAELIATCRSIDLHDGRAAIIRFESPLTHGVIPPADDAEECLVFVLPRIIVQEEEEELLATPTAAAK